MSVTSISFPHLGHRLRPLRSTYKRLLRRSAPQFQQSSPRPMRRRRQNHAAAMTTQRTAKIANSQSKRHLRQICTIIRRLRRLTSTPARKSIKESFRPCQPSLPPRCRECQKIADHRVLIPDPLSAPCIVRTTPLTFFSCRGPLALFSSSHFALSCANLVIRYQDNCHE